MYWEQEDQITTEEQLTVDGILLAIIMEHHLEVVIEQALLVDRFLLQVHLALRFEQVEEGKRSESIYHR